MVKAIVYSCLISTGVFTALSSSALEPVDLYIKNANLIDVTKDSEKDAVSIADIAIRDGKIVAIIPKTHATKVTARQIIDARGKWIIPGLHDMHVHAWRGNYSPGDDKFFGNRFQDIANRDQVGYRLLFSGVTSYLDLGGPSPFGNLPENEIAVKENVFEYRRKQREGAVSPRIFAAGPLFAVPGSHPGIKARPMNFRTIVVKDSAGNLLPQDQVIDSTRKTVESFIAAAHPDIIKMVYNNHDDLPSHQTETMPLYVAQTIIQAASKHGVKTVAHIGTWQAVKDLSNAGITAFTHLPHGAPPKEVIDVLLKNKTVAISTIAVYDDLGDMKDETKATVYTENPLLKLLTSLPFASTLLDYSKYDSADQQWADWGQMHSANRDQENALLGLYKAGVVILPGTDSMNTGAIHGYSLHRELIKWQETGIPAVFILRAATLASSQFLQEAGGRIQVGATADLVILRGNPLDKISNTQLIDEVIFNGRRFDQDTYRPLMVESSWPVDGRVH